MGLTQSGSVFGNFALNYLCIATVIWNLNVYATKPAFTMHWAAAMSGDFSSAGYYLVSLLNYAVYWVAIPLGVIFVAGRILRRWRAESDRSDAGHSSVDVAGEIGAG